MAKTVVVEKTIQISKLEFSDAELYDMVHEFARNCGREQEFLAAFGSRRMYLKKTKGA
jgi:hypothetical protein